MNSLMDITEKRTVGKSRLQVTPLGFGGGTIGMRWVTNETSLETVAAAWDTGVRFYDTAPFYGSGRSERRLGLALAGIAERDQYRINTKIGKSLVPEPVEDATASSKTPSGSERTPRDPDTGFRLQFEYTHDRILEQHRDSLQRLGTSSVDSLTIHDLDYGYQTVERMEQHLTELSGNGGGGAVALETLRAEGRIRAIGCGCNLEARNAYSWEDGAHERLCERIADLVDLDFFVIAGGYTLLETRTLRRILPLCQERGIGGDCRNAICRRMAGVRGRDRFVHVRPRFRRHSRPVATNARDLRTARRASGGRGVAISARPSRCCRSYPRSEKPGGAARKSSPHAYGHPRRSLARICRRRTPGFRRPNTRLATTGAINASDSYSVRRREHSRRRTSRCRMRQTRWRDCLVDVAPGIRDTCARFGPKLTVGGTGIGATCEQGIN